jgi:DNA-binding NarL/FixJ family response regulator
MAQPIHATTVLICDSLPVVIAGIRAVLAQDRGIRVVGEASDSARAVTLADRLRPDVAIIDSELPPLGCVEVVRRISSAAGGRPVKVIMVYGGTRIDPVPALSAGARAVVAKSDLVGCLALLVTVVNGVDAVLLPAGLIARLRLPSADRWTPPARMSEVLSRLTPREREVLMMVARGHNTRHIAAALKVSEATVRSHVHHVLYKLHLRDRAEVIVYAHRAGLVNGP